MHFRCVRHVRDAGGNCLRFCYIISPAKRARRLMAQMWYEVVAHEGGWAIMITPEGSNAFATKIDAYDTAVEFARKLRFSGYSVQVRAQHDTNKQTADARGNAAPRA